MVEDARWISEAEVCSLLTLREAIDALEAGLRLEAKGAARNMRKTLATFGGGGTLHAIGAIYEGQNLVGTKTWAHTAGGATPRCTGCALEARTARPRGPVPLAGPAHRVTRPEPADTAVVS